MEENFSMEWKIFGMEWKKITSMEYGKIVFHSIPCPGDKYFSGNYVIPSTKSNEDQKKKVFTAIWDYIRPDFAEFIRADRPFFVWSSSAQILMGGR